MHKYIVCDTQKIFSKFELAGKNNKPKWASLDRTNRVPMPRTLLCSNSCTSGENLAIYYAWKPIIPRIKNAAIKLGTTPIKERTIFRNKIKNIKNMPIKNEF